ncbi:MAG: J domain-containing protein [Dehalococcoidia bacterium]|nr:J domain-containing protein [Dehalococcoidia bacterium]
MASKDFYAVLGVPKTVSEKELKQAYRRLARRHHPDVNPGDKTAEQRFKEVTAAYEVLADPEKRKKYDRYGEHWDQAEQFARARASYGRTRTQGQPADMGAGLGFDDLLGGIFGRGGGRSRPRRGGDIEQPVEVTLEEAFSGATRTYQVQSEEPCTVCKGAGSIAGLACAGCQGTGSLARPRRIEVQIPPGVADGAKVRVAGEGQPGVAGGPKGDLFLLVKVRPHDRFERKMDDLYTDLPVELVTAMLGGEVQVATLKGNVALKIAAETQNGRTIRLAGLGMPKLGGPTQRGDLYARVKVVLPSGLTQEQRSLFEALKAAGEGSAP